MNNFLNTMSKVMKSLVKIEKIFIGLLFALSIIVIMISVIGRRLGNAPTWSEEVVRYCIIWVTFIGSAICFRRQSHFGVDIIKRINNKYFQKVIEVFVWLCSVFFAVFLVHHGYEFSMFVLKMGQKTAALKMPIAMVYISVPAGGVLILIHLVEVFLDRILNIYKIEE